MDRGTRRELLHNYLVDGLESAYRTLLSRGATDDDTEEETLSGSDTVAPRGTHSRTPSRSNIGLAYFSAASETPQATANMENTGIQTTQDRRPQVSINLPPIQPFTGRHQDHDSSGILDFIHQVEEHAAYAYYETDEARQAGKLSLFRRNLRAQARQYLDDLSPTEKADWAVLKGLYIHKFKTERDLQTKEDAWVQAATIRQKKDESVKSYAERALRVSQLVETDERYLVRRFMAGLRDASIQTALAAGYEDLNKATMRELHRKILSIVGASRRHGDATNDDDDFHATTDDDDGSGDEVRTKARSSKVPSRKQPEDPYSIIKDLEERLRKIELNAPQVEVLAVGTGQDMGGNQGMYQQWGGHGRSRQQGRGYQQPPDAQSVVCYKCGKSGHISRYCQDVPQGRPQGMGGYQIMVFPGPTGPMRARWIANPPNGLPPGYYPIEDTPNVPNQAAVSTNPRGGAPAGQTNTTSRITEVNDVAAVEAVSSAACATNSVRDLVRYVSCKDVNAVERRKLPQVLTDSHSEERPPRRRARTTYEEEIEVSDDEMEGGHAERITPEAGAGTGHREEGDTVRVRAGRSQPQEEDTVRVRAGRSQPQEGEATRVRTARRQEEAGQAAGRDKGKQRATVETEDEVVEVAAGPAVRKQIKRVRTPKAPRRIRMMLGQEGFDVLAEFREMPVQGLKWGALLDLAPSLRRVVGTGLLLEQQPRKPKAQKDKPVDALVVNTQFRHSDDEEPCTNFYTIASVSCGGQEFEVERTLIDAGSVVNLASHAVLERMGAPLLPAYDLTIRTATSTLTTIKYYSDLNVTVAGVTTRNRVYAIPREIVLSYGLLLSRRWLKKVKARGDYEMDTYYVQNARGKLRRIPRESDMRVNAVDVPTVKRADRSENLSFDEETQTEFELAETGADGGDGILREVISQATQEMRRQTTFGDTDGSGYDSGDEESGNGSGF